MEEHRGQVVHILMGVYNGADFLPEQLASFVEQTHCRWHLIASDDGSRDESRDVLAAFESDLAKQSASTRSMEIIRGPENGGAANFLHLIRHLARSGRQANWVAFSDQDDVWFPTKLERAIERLARVGSDQPALYCGRSLVTREDLTAPRLSVPRPRPPSFRNALVQNIAAGNTILLNPAATRLVCAAAPYVDAVVVHDWWLYQLVTGAGGQVIHDNEPGLFYRQHEANQIGVNDGLRARLKRLNQVLGGEFRTWNRINGAALSATSDWLTPENRALLRDFNRLRDLSLFSRLQLLRQMGLYRQTRASTLALWLTAISRSI